MNQERDMQCSMSVDKNISLHFMLKIYYIYNMCYVCIWMESAKRAPNIEWYTALVWLALSSAFCVYAFICSWSFDAYVTIVFTIHKRIPAPPQHTTFNSLLYTRKTALAKIYTKMWEWEYGKEVERKKTETEETLLIFFSFPFCSDFSIEKWKILGETRHTSAHPFLSDHQ